MILLYIILLIACFYLLAIICDEFFVPSLDIMAQKLKMPSDVAGATLMAVGSSAPELFTALFAVFRPGNFADIGAGTIVGSAIFNILVIIGASASFRRAHLTWQPVIRDMLFYAFAILILLGVFWDGRIVLGEALAFLALYIVYILAVINWKKFLPYKDVDPVDVLERGIKKNKLALLSKKLLELFIPDSVKHPKKYVSSFIVSIIFIAGLSYLLVESAVGIGEMLHINPTIIALTVLAAGTSIPDLFSSVIVARQGRGDMAVSNAVGSNIFDILFGLGFPWALVILIYQTDISVATENLIGSIVLLFATIIAILFVLVVRNWSIGRRSGFILIALYIAYLIYNILEI